MRKVKKLMTTMVFVRSAVGRDGSDTHMHCEDSSCCVKVDSEVWMPDNLLTGSLDVCLGSVPVDACTSNIGALELGEGRRG